MTEPARMERELPSFKTRIPLISPPTEAQRAFVVFHPSRSVIKRASGDGDYARLADLDEFDETSAREFPHVVEIVNQQWTLASGAIEVESEGERVEVVGLVYELPRGSVVRRSKDGQCFDGAEVYDQPSPRKALKELPGISKYIKAVDHAIASMPSPKKEQCRFFFEIDRRTAANLRGFASDVTPGQRALIDSLGGVVSKRFEQGLKGHLIGALDPLYSYQGTGAEVRYVAQLFYEQMPDSWKRSRDGVDPMAVGSAFERFANGQLRTPVFDETFGITTTQPSSGFYFYFAQLAFLAAEVLDRALATFWGQMANAMVRTQEVFTRNYSPDNAEKSPCSSRESSEWRPEDYCGCNFAQPRYTDKELDQLRRDYAKRLPRDLEKQAAINAEKAFPGLAAELKGVPPLT